MSDEILNDMTCEVQEASVATVPRKAKRDIIRFQAEKPMAINLEHVASVSLEGKRITFEFHTKAQYVDCEDEAAASSIFELILKTWVASDVVE